MTTDAAVACARAPDRTRRALLAAALLPVARLAFAATPPDGTPYALPDTFVHDVPDPKSGRRYQLWVDVPKSYAGFAGTLPVVFVTDAPYAFPLLRSLRARVGQGGQNIEDFVLVGLAPPVGEASATSRLRDYTPTDPLQKSPQNLDRYGGTVYGEAERYRDYLETVALPFAAQRYRIDLRRSLYLGHSYGGLFGAHVLLTSPRMFRAYALGSPSLWFDQRVIFELERAYARRHPDLPAQVMMYCGSFETRGAGPRYATSVDMVRDMKAFERALQGRRYPSLRIGSRVIDDEDHLTVFPALATRALVWALPGKGPYTSG